VTHAILRTLPTARILSPSAPYGYRPEKDYLGEAFIALILYYVGLGIVGLIVNIVFLGNARRDQSVGITTRDVGCLQTLL